jgi:signal transduction histidine kinase
MTMNALKKMNIAVLWEKLNQKRRFAALMTLIYIVSLPIISVITYYILKQHAIDNAYNTASLYLRSYEETRHYVAEELRPVLQKELPGRFVIQGMSRSYVARSISRRVLKELPGHRFKNASLNPRNPLNRADELETRVINEFRRKSDIMEWKGLIEEQDAHYYVLARAGLPIQESCLSCHGDPQAAPKEMVAQYGASAGFQMKVGERVDALMAYIPVHVALEEARRTVAVFIGLYTVFFAIIFYLINMRFEWFYGKIESDRNIIESVNKEVMNLNHEMEDIVAERTMGMFGLKVADRIRNPVTVIGGLCRQLSKKETEGLPAKKFQMILDECMKMETIVADFDALVKSKSFLFKREDLNEITSTIAGLMERKIKDAGLRLVVKLHDKQLMFNANRQLIKISIQHIIGNAVDASSPGGEIIIETGEKDDNPYLTIKDTGKGLTPEELHRIFEPFYSTKGRTGMGLPLVRQIITEHMGEITLDSESGVGTTVRFIFPARWKEEMRQKKIEKGWN